MDDNCFVTKSLLVINVLVFLIMLCVSISVAGNFADAEIFNASLLVSFGAIIPQESSFLTLVGYMFLHGSFLHIFLNILNLNYLGKKVEVIFGSWYLILYLLSGFVAGLGVYYFGDNVTIGASGAICGIFSSLIFYEFKYGMDSGLKKGLIVDSILLFGISLFPGVSMLGHLFGFLSGLVLSWFYFSFIYDKKLHDLREEVVVE